ncbi:hypothetical protein [Photobacterium angustum]|uniref:hypothetical protein n=1 Tax=Photobacterium angustum TaxID=661 RepID=UPI000A74A729|nr:hypothetical protein [Photobacterium angustum]
MADWVDDSHQSLTDTVHDIGEYLDESLAKDEDEGALTNRSYLRIRNRLAYSYRGKLDNDFKVYFKLDLPHVKRDWKLIIDSEPGDFDSLKISNVVLPQATKPHLAIPLVHFVFKMPTLATGIQILILVLN